MRTHLNHARPLVRAKIPSVLLGIGLVLTGASACSSDDAAATDSASDTTATGASAAGAADAASGESAALSITDPWIKTADDGMTAAFGTLVNSSDRDIVVTSATSEITSAMELHETVANDDGSMAMQPKEDGFTIPAGGTHELTPGGDHLMVMDLKRPLEPGEKVVITLTLDDGSTMDVDATAKDFSGADEKYQNGDGDMDMGSGMEMDAQ